MRRYCTGDEEATLLAKRVKNDILNHMSAAEDISLNETEALLSQLAELPPVLDALRAALATPMPAGADQFCAHGRAWAATYVETLGQMVSYSETMQAQNRFGPMEQNLTLIIVGEYLNHLHNGLPMSQGETVRPIDIGFETLPGFDNPAVLALMRQGNSAARRRDVAQLMADSGVTEADAGLDETHLMIRDQFRRFADEKVMPFAHGWHLNDELIPLDLIKELAALGVFGLTIPEEFGGMGMGQTSHVRGVGRIVTRLYRRRLFGHAHRYCR